MKRFFTKLWTQVKRFFKGLLTPVGIILIIGTIVFAVLFLGSLAHHYYINIPFFLYLDKGQLVTYVIALLAAIVVYSQIVSLREQLQVQTLMEYSKQWNSSEMVARRKAAMTVLKRDSVTKEDEDLDKLEQVLELLEDFSTLAEKGVLDEELVWESSVGWYASRYWYYSNLNGSIKAIQKKWGIDDAPDYTYYKKLESLYDGYLKNEEKNRGIERKRIKDGYGADRERFIQSEEEISDE